MKRVIIIANPVAGRASQKKLWQAALYLKKKGFIEEIVYTEKPGDGIRFSREFIKINDKIYAVIAAGGDGTFNEVANGLTGTDIPMAILPLGTTNVLAKELGIPESVEEAINLLDREPITVRPAMIKLSPISGSPVKRYFLLMAGIGFDGEAVYGVNKRLKRAGGKLAYILSGIKNLLKYNPSPLKIKIEDGSSGSAIIDGYNAVICKGSCYGGYFKMAPDADLKNPSLYAVIFTRGDRYSIIRYATGIITGRHLRFKDIIYKKITSVVIEPERHVQIDGDYLGKGTVEINTGAHGLKIFSP